METIKIKSDNLVGYPIHNKLYNNLEATKQLVEALKDHTKEDKFIFCVTGSSGMFMGTVAITMCPDSILFYVRKSDESSHGGNVEYSDSFYNVKHNYKKVFIDDFISTGITFERVNNNVIDKTGKSVDIVCVGWSNDTDVKICEQHSISTLIKLV